MNQQPRKKELGKRMDKVRGLTGMAMGIVYIVVGVLIILAEQKKMLQLGTTLSWMLGLLAVLYGLFRIWRGWQIRKNAIR